MSAAAPETYGIPELASIVADQRRQIEALAASLHEGNQAGSPRRTEGRRLGYRFDAAPKWLCESGWREQSREHRKAWPLLWRLLELERWAGAHIRVTKKQLADHLGVSEDTVKRRLAWLEQAKTIELTPGSGRRPSTVVIHHPIATPLAYDEVPWPAGGLMDPPPGYLEHLSGAGRAYAELYGVELPEPSTVPDQPPEAPYLQGEPTGSEGEPPLPSAEALPPRPAAPGGAGCIPSETRDVSSVHGSIRQDAHAREEAQQPEGPTEREESPVRKMEREAKAVPQAEIGEEAIADARRICEALGRNDELTAARAVQVAELLRRKRWEYLLTDALSRIRGARRSDEIRRPIPYLCATVLSIAQRSGLSDDERALAADVLAPPDALPKPPGRTAEGPRRAPRHRRRGLRLVLRRDSAPWHPGAPRLPQTPKERARGPGPPSRIRVALRWISNLS